MKNRMVGSSGIMITICLIAVMILTVACSGEPSWNAENDNIIARENITVPDRPGTPDTHVTPNLGDGAVSRSDDLGQVILAPGVNARIFWGSGALVSIVTMEPGAEIPREELPVDRLMVMTSGSVKQLVAGKMVAMADSMTATPWIPTPHRDMLYLREGSMNAVTAGDSGAEFIEIYSPVRTDYIEQAGGDIPRTVVMNDTAPPPEVPAGRVVDFYSIQLASLADNVLSRIMQSRGFQAGFLAGEPGTSTDWEVVPEECIMLVLRGGVDQTTLDTTTAMGPGDICFIPSGMAHKRSFSAKGADILEVYWPGRPDYRARMIERRDMYHTVIPPGTRPVLEHDGLRQKPALNFTEGPCWHDGSLYFSNMWFAPDFSAGSPEKSNLIRMNDQSIEVVERGMQTNGIMPLGNGNLAVCDMFGHRIIEMTPSGNVVRTLASEYNAVPVDGPNDLVVDAKGGIYFTDPQFTPGLEKTQPGKAVYYRRPGGTVIRVIEPGAFGMPNGILLSPDGATCYINNTHSMPVGNHVMAFDVNSDGTLTNGREFAEVVVPSRIRENGAVATGADGMTIDTAGNLYVATLEGLQIFNPDGELMGIVHLPVRPVSCAFGGPDMSTVYCACPTRIYSIKTNMRGLSFPLE